MDPNGTFPMQFYDPTSENSNTNGFSPNHLNTRMAAPMMNNLAGSASQGPPYGAGFRGTENGMSRYNSGVSEQFDMQNFSQQPQYSFSPTGRRNDANFGIKEQGLQGLYQNQAGSFGPGRDSYPGSSPNADYGSFFPSQGAKGRMLPQTEMFGASAQTFGQARQQGIQNFNPNTARDFYGNQAQMASMGMGNMGQQQVNQQAQMNARMGPQNPDFAQYGYQNRPDMNRQGYFGQDPTVGFGKGPRQRPDGFNMAFYQGQGMQQQSQMQNAAQRANMYGQQGFGSQISGRSTDGQNSAQRAALLAAAAVRAAAAASSGRAKREFPGGAYPNTYQYGPRAMSPQDFMGSPYSQPGSSGMQSPSAKELSGAMSPMGPNMPRMPFRNTTPSPLNPGSVPSRNSSNSMPYSPAISGDQGGFSSPTYQSQAKGPYGSPSLPRPQSQSGFSAGNRPGSGSDCSRKSDLEQDSKSQVFANSGMQGSSEDLQMLNDLSVPSVEDVEAMMDSVNRVPGGNAVNTENTEGKEVKVKVEDEQNTKDIPCEADKPIKAEPDRKSVVSPSSRSSAPPTPLSGISGVSPVPSPFQDELDFSNLSPSWPQTPTSPTTKQKLKAHSPAKFDQLSKLYELSEDEERRTFLDKYLAFMSVNGTPITKVPIVGKQVLDLYKLFRAVVEQGGLQEVMKRKKFRDVLRSVNLPSSSSTLAYTIKNQYIKYLLAFENKNKDTYMSRWRNDMSAESIKAKLASSIAKGVPTIALNDTLPSAMKDMNRMGQSHQFMNDSRTRPPMGPGGPDMGLRDWQSPPGSSSNQVPFQQAQGGRQMAFNQAGSTAMSQSGSSPFNQGGQAAFSQGGPTPYSQGGQAPFSQGGQIPFSQNGQMAFSQSNSGYGGPGAPDFPQSRPNYPGPTPYAPSPEMPPGYQQSSMMRFQRPQYPRNAVKPYPQGPGTGQQYPSQFQQGSPMSPTWPRNFPPRPGPQGPPELFPEGLQRPPWGPQQGMSPQSRTQYANREASRSALKRALRDHHTPWPVAKASPKPGPSTPTTDTDHSEQKPHSLIHPGLKRDLSMFPPDSVESTKPVLKKRRKLTSKDLGPVEAWRIMMSLKSGMMAECTWAIDTLNILLYDNNTISYFHLGQLPGLLDALLDHFRKCLIDILGLMGEVEIPLHIENEKALSVETKDQKRTHKDLLEELWVGVCKNSKTSFSATIAADAIEDENLKPEGFKSGWQVWKDGGSDNSSHINLSFPCRPIPLRTYPEISQRTHNSSSNPTEPNDHKTETPSLNCSASRPDSETKNIELKKLGSLSQTTDKSFKTLTESTSSDRVQESTIKNVSHSDSNSSSVLTPQNETPSNKHTLAINISEKDNPSLSTSNENTTAGSTATVTTSNKGIPDENTLDRNPSTRNSFTGNTSNQKTSENHNGSSGASLNKSADGEQDNIDSKRKADSNDVESQEGIKASTPVRSTPNKVADKISEDTNCKKSSDSHNRKRDKVHESKSSVNLAMFEDFEAMRLLEQRLKEPKVKQEPTIERLCHDLELDSEYNQFYLDKSKDFIGYLRKRLIGANRGTVVSQEATSKPYHPFVNMTDTQESSIRRLISVSNIIRSLSYVNGNDDDLAGSPGLLLILGKLLLFKHEHPVTDHSEFRLAQEDSEVGCQVATSTSEWWWDGVRAARENVLVALANISGQLNLTRYQENIALPILNGLLHWLVCQSSEARDPLPTAPEKYALSAKRLALETLAKMSITEGNVDLILATPPTSRLHLVFKELVKAIAIKSSIPVREFAIVLLDNLARGENTSLHIASQKPCIANVIAFLEEAESSTAKYVSVGGVVQPGLSAEDVCGTSVNMLRRAADILLCLAKVRENRRLFVPFTDRLLALSTSQMMDTSVLGILSAVMFELR